MNCIGISCNLAEAKCVGDLQGKLMLIPSPETAQDLMPTQREVMAVLFLTLLNDKRKDPLLLKVYCLPALSELPMTQN